MMKTASTTTSKPVKVVQLVIPVSVTGPNDLNLFQPVDGASSTQPLFAELCLKLVVYFNSKVRT